MNNHFVLNKQTYKTKNFYIQNIRYLYFYIIFVHSFIIRNVHGETI
jgi:hypothetical protein